ncbi:heat-inducible transcriptional repressor HrcA [Corynebacterium caspium]|uniref:heat-inducible transcriptional repressor HrcA n=1 Tax=Corynebacterium caspium TaxID=234828 RepID=UPI00037CC425|nr:heat-inducible transcriptional repressor HrcA [Corynebacterium caspium]WKD58891.1 Heat-inducible transcription repressor HrcA [Corynebacterium caspium DSM 44850]
MAGAAEKRRQQVLRAIIADYSASQEPVGSKALLERHKLNVSSATIRNDMAVLEAEGLIQQQHASSGRIPTQKGYREFVDSLKNIAPISEPERRAIIRFLEEGVDLEDVLRRSVQLLSQLTRQAAVVALPNLEVSRVKHIEVVALSPLRLLVVLITDNGRVEQRNVELGRMVDAREVHELRDQLNSALVGKTVLEASDALTNIAEMVPSEGRDIVLRASNVLIETLVERPSDRFIVAGASHLARVAGDIPTALPELLDALEEQVVMLRLLSNVPDLGNVSVLIGEENIPEQLHAASVVTTSYGSSDTALGGLGVVGPTYMDYTGTITRVSTVAQYVSKIVGGC